MSNGRLTGKRILVTQASKTVVRDDLKLTLGWGKHRGVSLYNIAMDPAETRDLSASHGSVVRELTAIAKLIEKENLASEPTGGDTAVLEKLRSLGYIE